MNSVAHVIKPTKWFKFGAFASKEIENAGMRSIMNPISQIINVQIKIPLWSGMVDVPC